VLSFSCGIINKGWQIAGTADWTRKGGEKERYLIVDDRYGIY